MRDLIKKEQQRLEADALIEQRQSRPKSSSQRGGQDFSMYMQDEVIPATDEGKEAYVMKQLQTGEALLAQGPPAYEAAATCFYRALKLISQVRMRTRF